MFGFFLVVLAFVILWTLGILAFIIRVFPVLKSYRWWIFSIGLVLSALFFAGMSMEGMVSIWLYRIGAIWLGGITLACLVAIVFFFVGLLVSKKWISWRSFGLFACFVIFLNGWGIYSGFSPRVVQMSVEFQGDHDWHGKKIVMLADTHYGYIHGIGGAEKLAVLVNSLDPDIVLIPGDFFDGPQVDFGRIARVLSQIKSKYGILFANGNHEEYRNTDAMLDAIREAGVQLLNNRVETIDGVQFAGVTYHMTEDEKGLEEVLESLHLDATKPAILLKHKPTFTEIVGKYPFDLVVSGHTHKAQMWPFSYITTLMYGKYAYGKHSVNDRLSWVTTSGVGTWGPPQRLGSRSEVILMVVE